MSVTYPLDLTGTNPSNLVTNELHSVQESQFRDYYFIVPNFAPFYVNNFNITLTVNNVTTTLVEDVDYSFIMPYITGTRVTGHAMYGAITLHNINANGILSLTYQTLGGDMVVDRLEVLTMLANLAYNPRTIAFDLVANTPSHWPPEPHQNKYDEYYGQEELVAALDRVKDAILSNSTNIANEIQNLFALLNSGTLNNYVLKSGDTMTGPLILSGPPIQPQQAATKEYVDNNAVNTTTINSLLANYATRQYVDAQDNLMVSKTGDNMTGPLSLSGPPIQSSHATTKQYVDNIESNLQAQINNLQAQINTINSDPVTKSYVDDRINEILAIIIKEK